MSSEKRYVRGLKDVAACETHISFVDPLGALYYVGYDNPQNRFPAEVNDHISHIPVPGSRNH